MVDEAYREVMRPNDPQLKTIVFHPLEVAPINGKEHAGMSTRAPTLIFVSKWVNNRYALLNVCETAHGLNASIKRYRLDSDDHVIFLHIMVSVETLYSGIKVSPL